MMELRQAVLSGPDRTEWMAAKMGPHIHSGPRMPMMGATQEGSTRGRMDGTYDGTTVRTGQYSTRRIENVHRGP